jgi:hypothetical protein
MMKQPAAVLLEVLRRNQLIRTARFPDGRYHHLSLKKLAEIMVKPGGCGMPLLKEAARVFLIRAAADAGEFVPAGIRVQAEEAYRKSLPG